MKEIYKPSQDEEKKSEEVITPEQKEMSKDRIRGINQEIKEEISKMKSMQQDLIDTIKSKYPEDENITVFTGNTDKAIQLFEDELQKNLEWLDKK